MTEATLAQAIEHGLSEDEWRHILRVLNRTPNHTDALGTIIVADAPVPSLVNAQFEHLRTSGEMTDERTRIASDRRRR